MLLLDLFVVLVLTLGVLTCVMSIWYAIRWVGAWRLAAVLPVLALLAWASSIVLAWPTEHTLWPVELVLGSPVALAYLLVLRWMHAAAEGAGHAAGAGSKAVL